MLIIDNMQVSGEIRKESADFLNKYREYETKNRFLNLKGYYYVRDVIIISDMRRIIVSKDKTFNQYKILEGPIWLDFVKFLNGE